MLSDNRAMDLLPLEAPPLLAGSATSLRPVARRIASAFRHPPDRLVQRATALAVADCTVGRVHGAGKWADPLVQAALAEALDAIPPAALKQTFEWYLCRGAHFHTDAHFSDVLFGVWYVAGPPVDVVFARARLRVPARPGSILAFDPFEVHGVLRPGASEYRAEDYGAEEPSIFAGFEIGLEPAVRTAFDVTEAPGARLISSSTRIAATTGAYE